MRPTPQKIENRIQEMIQSPQNTLNLRDEAAFGVPVVGYANGADKLFRVQKYENGMPGLNPMEWLEAKYGKLYAPSRVSVISWALPILAPTREKMREERYHPCYEWALNRTYGGRFNQYLASQMVDFFEKLGIDAISPVAELRVQRARIEKFGLSTNWSEPLAAFVCGLGTLRAPDGIITEVGACVQLGSVIVAAKLPITKRVYTRMDEYCLLGEGCTACIERCPAAAITRDGLDMALCLKYQTMHILPYVKKKFEFEGVSGCGLCLTGVPCEACRPDTNPNA